MDTVRFAAGMTLRILPHEGAYRLSAKGADCMYLHAQKLTAEEAEVHLRWLAYFLESPQDLENSNWEKVPSAD